MPAVKTRSKGLMDRSRSTGNVPAVLRFADGCASLVRRVVGVSSVTPWFFQPRIAEPLRSSAENGADDMTPGQMIYHLRRLRGLITRIPAAHRYRVTRQGPRAALFCTGTYNRILRPRLAQIIPEHALDDSEPRRAFDQFHEKIDHWIAQQKLPA